jgi:2',3'-cyclic-nucleotide 2'-phosphodiesterase (5'-nucleotidase family)
MSEANNPNTIAAELYCFLKPHPADHSPKPLILHMRKSTILLLAALLATNLFAQGQSKNLTLLYTNDLHAHLEPQKLGWISDTRLIGGFANIATLVKEEKKKNPNTIYVDAGDFFTGPYISSLTKGEAIIDVLNNMSLDIACIGNHEFDHGWQNVPKQFKKAKFPIVNGNIFIKSNNKLIWDNPYKIIVVNGIRIGIIGLHGKFAFYDTTSEEMVRGVECRDEVEYLKKYIATLKNKTDIILLLVHEGIPGRQSSTGSADVARNLQKDIELAQRVSGIDILVTGHAHQGTKEALISNGTIIVSTDALGMELGKLELSYDPTTDKITSFKNTLDYIFDDEVKDDSLTLNAINKWKEKLKNITEQKVCTIPSPITRSYGEESPMGNMVSDAILNGFQGIDMVLTNSGGYRDDIPEGQVTIGSLISTFPFPNTVVICDLKGSDIKKLLEHGASLTNGILQVSKGMKVVYDEKKPIGNRIVSAALNNKQIDDNKIYKVATSNFVADGGDGYTEFKNASLIKRTGIEILETMTQYLKSKPTYTPFTEGRIVALK